MYWRFIVDGGVGARRIRASDMCECIHFWYGDTRFVLKLYCLGAWRRMVVMSKFYICQNLVCTGRTPPSGLFPNILSARFCFNFAHISKLHVPPNTAHSMVSETCAHIMMENITYFHQFAKSVFFSRSNWPRNITATVISRTTTNLWKSF